MAGRSTRDCWPDVGDRAFRDASAAMLNGLSIVKLNMVIERLIQRHQLTFFLKVFNRFTDKPIGYLGNVSDGGLMLISQLPMLVDANFEFRIKLPGCRWGGAVYRPDSARCLWCREDLTPHYYDSGFILYQPPAEYSGLISALQRYSPASSPCKLPA